MKGRSLSPSNLSDLPLREKKEEERRKKERKEKQGPADLGASR